MIKRSHNTQNITTIDQHERESRRSSCLFIIIQIFHFEKDLMLFQDLFYVICGRLLDLNFKLTMSIESGMHISSRLVSSTQKREIMWNIIEPGDPYDIRKSMIAKLPGRKNFMGEHLELVCLLQAAEIERISQYLDEYKLKFREIERRELDRHSYEIQIKELTQQLSEEGTYKLQNSKLKEFIRKQTIEFEEMKKKSGGYEIEVSRKYQDSLRQVESLIQQNELLKLNANKARLDFQQVLNVKTMQNDQLQRRLKETSSIHSSEYSQKSEAYFKLQIEYKKLQFENKRIKEIAETKNQEIEDLQNKSKQFIYQIEELNSQIRTYGNINHTITEYENRFSLLGKEIDRLNLVLREKTADVSDANNTIRVLEDETRRKNEYINELQRRKTELDQRYMQMEVKMVESMKNLNGLDESRSLVKTYEVNLEKLSSQIERLNSVLRKKVQELDQANRKKSQYEYELKKSETILKELDEYRFKYGEFNKKFADYQNKIALLSQEIERLNQVLRRKQEEINSFEQQFRSKNSELDAIQRKYNQIDFEYKNQISRISAQNQQLQSRIVQLTQENDFTRSKFEELIQQSRSSPSKTDIQKYFKGQIERLNQLVQSKTVEIQRYQKQQSSQPKIDTNVFEIEKQRIIQQYELEITNRNKEIEKGRQTISQYERRIIGSAQEIERLSILLKRNSAQVSPSKQQEEELAFQYRKISEYENKLAIMDQQIERLNQNLRSRVNENKNLESRLKNYDNELQMSRKRQTESFTIAISDLERKNAGLVKENQHLKEGLSRKASDNQQSSTITKEYELKIRQIMDENNQTVRKLSEYEFQMNTLSDEIQRLNNILQVKVNQNIELQTKIKKLSLQLEDNRRKLSQYQSRISQINRQSEINSEKYSRNAQYQIETLKRKINELQTYNSQYQSTVRGYEEQIYVSRQEKERYSGQVSDHQKKFSEYENKIVILSQQIERLNEILTKLNSQNTDFKRKFGEIDYLKTTIVTLEEKFSRAAQQNDELRKGVSESNVTKTKISQDFEYKMRSLSQQNEDILRKYRALETNIANQQKQYDNLSSILKSKTEQIKTYDSKLRGSYQQNETLTRKIQELTNVNRKIGEYDSKIAILSQEIERLNSILRTKVDEINSLEVKCRNYDNQIMSYQRKIQQYETTINGDLQTKITFISKENQQLKVKVKQLTGEVNKIPEFQSKFAMVYGQIERLNTILRSKTDEMHSLQNKNRSLEQEIDKYKKRNEDLQNAMHRELKNQSSVFEQRVNQLTDENDVLRKNLRELSDANRKIGEYESKVVLLSKQIERLNELLAKYSKQIVPELEDNVRNLSYSNEDLKRKFTQLSEVNKSNQELMTRFKVSTQENEQYIRRIQQYETRMAQISGEVERLNTVLRGKLDELNQSDGKLKRVLNQNDSLISKLRESSDFNKKIPEFQNKIAILSQEIERLNSLLKIKIEQSNSFENELRKYKYQYQTLQRRYNDLQGNLGEFKSSRTALQQKISSLNQQNEQIRKTVRELSDSNRRISDYQSRMALLSQQIERLNGNLMTKTEERNSFEIKFKNYQKDADSKISNLNQELDDYRRKTGQSLSINANKIAEYENKILILSQQIERLNYVLKQHTYEIEVFQKKEPQYLSQIERLNNTLRLKVEETIRWEQSNQELKIRMKSYEQNLHLANQEYENLKKSHSTLTEEYTKANKHLVEYEQSINKLYQEFERLQAIMNDLKKENYDLKLRLQESGNLVDMNRALSAEIDRLNRIVDTQNRDLEDLRLNLADQSALQKRIGEDMALMVVLFAEIESLRRRVKQTEIQIESVRRSSLAPFKV